MNKSESIAKLAEALNKFQASIGAVKKDGANPFYKSKYATLDNIWDSIRKELTANGLAVSQLPCGENEMMTVLLHTSGEYISATAKMTPKDSTPQGQGSAITYLRRYALSALLGLTSEEDDDGNAASAKQYVAPAPRALPGTRSVKATPPVPVPDTPSGSPF